jgi:hypothetical protein
MPLPIYLLYYDLVLTRAFLLFCSVRDFSKAQVTLAPAEYASWSDARSEMMIEMKRPLKAQLSAELAAAPNDEARDEITQAFAAREKALEHDLGTCSPMEIPNVLFSQHNICLTMSLPFSHNRRSQAHGRAHDDRHVVQLSIKVDLPTAGPTRTTRTTRSAMT